MLRYRTEIIVPTDRYVFLQLPDHLPEGRAIVTISYHDPEASADAESNGDAADREIDLDGPTDPHDPDHDDIEWWDEFEGQPEPTP